MATAATTKAAPRKRAAPRVIVKPAEPTTLEEAIALHKAEIEKIGKALNAAAAKEGLCEKYYTVIEGLNKSLAVPLPENPMVATARVFITVQLDEKVYPLTTNNWGGKTLSNALQAKLSKAMEAAAVTIEGVTLASDGYLSSIDVERSKG
jgi:hypothetical protein